MSTDGADEIERFWRQSRDGARMTPLPGYLPSSMLEMVPPPVWSFGTTPEDDLLMEAVLDEHTTSLSSAQSDYDAAGESLPEVRTLGILLDSTGHPRALVETTQVDVVAFDQVSEEHARSEGCADLAEWREAHADYAEHDPGALVVLEQFRVLHRA